MAAESSSKAPTHSYSICNRSPYSSRSASKDTSLSKREISIRLDTSFVNVPYSPPTATLDSNRREWHGSEMYEITRRLEGMVHAAQDMIGDNCLEMAQTYYCKPCLDRIGQSLDEHSSMIMNECRAYDAAATREEERVDSIKEALSKLAKNITTDSSINEGNAVEWALNQFNLEIQALTQACKEQEDEIHMLQNIMQEQLQRSKSISSQEENAYHELNALERDAYNFTEESHHISIMCSSVFSEIESLSHVKLISTLFHLDISQNGRYPLINNLRLAYRTNEKANLHREEINAAWVQAAQLLTFTCGLYPEFQSSPIRIIPLSYPCAKIQMLTSPSGGDGNGKHVYNLGWDQAEKDDTNHIPTPSLVAFLSLFSDLASLIVSKTNDKSPPYEMTQCTIDCADVTKLHDSDSDWSSVVYCMACNLHWLTQVPVNMPCVL